MGGAEDPNGLPRELSGLENAIVYCQTEAQHHSSLNAEPNGDLTIQSNRVTFIVVVDYCCNTKRDTFV